MHEIKFDGYRIQRVEASKVSLKTRKGLVWTVKFGAIAEAASDLPDAILDGEIVALDANGAPDFAALQAALSDGRTEELIFFAFDLLHDGAAAGLTLGRSKKCAAINNLGPRRERGVQASGRKFGTWNK